MRDRPFGLIYQLAAGKTRKCTATPMYEISPGVWTQTLREAMEFELNALIPSDTKPDTMPEHQEIRAQAAAALSRDPLHENADEITADVEETEVWRAMERLGQKLRKAPGPDGVRPEHVAKAAGPLLGHLTALFAACVHSEHHPIQ